MVIDVIILRRILKICRHYDEIINLDFEYDDELSIEVIDWYEALILSCDKNDENKTKIIKMIDNSMYIYVNDYKYRKGLSKIISSKDIDLNCERSIKKLIKKIIDYTSKYEKFEILNVSSSRWI